MKPLNSLWIAVLSAGFAGSAVSGPLDAPITPKAPTVGSEIHRGADAANACEADNSGPFKVDGFYECVQHAHDDNRQRMGAGFEAFDAGLYYVAKRNLTIDFQVLQKSPSGGDTSMLAANLNLINAAYTGACDALKLGDADVMTASVTG